MSNKLSTLEEFDSERRIRTPHLLYSKKSQFASKNIAFVVSAKSDDEILLINSIGLEDTAVIAGLSEKHIEQLAKKATQEQKECLLNAVRDERYVQDVLAIAKEMDEDLGASVKSNQQRVQKVLQYISDNRLVFQF